LIYINAVLIRHGLDEIILTTPLLRPVRFLLYLLPWNWVRRKRAPRAIRLRRALEDLGPIFVKFGQIMSTRRDLLPEDIADELANLQDQVPPFPGAQARAIVERALQSPVEDLFADFDEAPLASASIAQVHAARLKDGRDVVVKVVRPGIEVVIRRDVGLLYLVAELAERYWREGRRLHPRQIVAEYETTILDELDLMREGASASQLRRNFMDSELLKVPEVYWDYTRPNVMVMERVSGIPISDVKALKAHGVDLKVLAERGVEIFFTQVMRHNFFHADMHPGNIFVSREDPQNPRYVAVDFGIMGSLSPEDQHYLAENFIAFFNRDYHRVAVRAHLRAPTQGHLLRPAVAEAVSDGTAVQHGGTAAAGVAAEDAAQHRRTGSAALPGSGSVANGKAVSRAMDGRAARSPRPYARAQEPRPALGRNPARAARPRLRGPQAGAQRKAASRACPQ
jgi:ubiquinone biosynthesis protein